MALEPDKNREIRAVLEQFWCNVGLSHIWMDMYESLRCQGRKQMARLTAEEKRYRKEYTYYCILFNK